MKNVTPWHEPPSLLQPRSHFSSLHIGHEFLCHGGIGKFGCALDDFIKIDLKTFQWQAINISNPKEGPQHVSSGALCLVAFNQRQTLTLDETSPVLWDYVRCEIKKEGIYVFGGLKGEQLDHEVEDTNLYCLSIGSSVHTWEKLTTSGPSPIARYQHSMHFIRQSNIMLVLGGRALRGRQSLQLASDYIQDTSVLNLLTMEWSLIEIRGYSLTGVYGFSSCIN